MNTKEQWEENFELIFGKNTMTVNVMDYQKVKNFIRETREQAKKEERKRIYNELLTNEKLQFEILKIDDDTLGNMCKILGLQ